MYVFLLSGKKRSGKNTVADIIKKYYFDYKNDLKEYAYADKLKKAVMEIFDLSYDQLYGDSKEENTHVKWSYLTDAIRAKYKDKQEKSEYLTVRELMQIVGTDVFRESFYPEIWVDSLWRQITQENPKMAIITDARFVNEIERAREIEKEHDLKVFSISVVRPSLESNDDHKSENQLNLYNGYDSVIVNNGSLEDLESKVFSILSNFGVY